MTTEVRAPSVPIYLAGELVEAGTPLEVRNPANGELVATTWQAGPDELEQATAAAAAFDQTRRLASYERRDALQHVADAIARDADELAELLTRESGKPIRDARGEVARGSLTFRTAAEEALRINGEWLPLDWTAANRGRSGIVRRYPIGPVAGISPFNFPLNLAAHKVAPAIAAGCSIVLKPPSQDPLVMLRIAGYLAETALPKGSVSILPMDRPTGDRMVADDRFKLLSFTGSPSVGWKMKTDAGRKKVVPRAGRQRGGHRGRDRGPRLGGVAAGVRRLRLRRAGVHQRPAHLRRGLHLPPSSSAASSRRSARSGWAIPSIPRPTSGRWSTRQP